MLPGSEPQIDPLAGLSDAQPVTEEYRTSENAPVDEAQRALVQQVIKGVQAADAHWAPVFKQMRADQSFARGKQWEQLNAELNSAELYTVNIVHRHVQQRVSTLYAKNPTFVAKRRDTIDYTVWDGRVDTIERVQEQMMMSAQTGMVDPNAQLILEDFIKTGQRREMLERFGKTLEIAMKHYIDEQVLPFKKQMKKLVRRTITCGAGYVMLDFQRVMGLSPGAVRQIDDFTERLARIEQLSRDMAKGDVKEDSPEAATLKNMIAELQKEPELVLREGLVFNWPSSADVIPDLNCASLDGFVGCDFVAVRYALTPDQIKRIYEVDIRASYNPYQVSLATKALVRADKAGETCLAQVFVVYHKRDGLVYVVCDGFPDFLQAPAAPNVRLERFWPIFTLMFNECDSDEDVYPPSDVSLLRHPQWDYNRARQALREHRVAHRPMTATAAGQLTEDDKLKIETRPAHAVVELQALQPGQKVGDLLQPVQFPIPDAALYDTETQFSDVLRAVGTQEANLGGTGGATATETSIAESSRLSSLQSSVDDLDELLTELARAGGQVLLQNVSAKTIQGVVGPGAVWPQMSAQEIAEEMYLDVKAGSSGRPNQAAQIQNMTQVAPFLIQIPGIKPSWLATQMLERMDDRLDLTDAFDPALPSITALNAQKQPNVQGDPESDPNAQGPAGQQNAQQPGGAPGDTAGPGRPPMNPNLDLDPQSGIAVN